MKVLLIHLSDIHFKDQNNSVISKQEKIFDCVKNSTLQFEEIFLIISGDSAFSGKQNEYDIAKKFILKLKDEIVAYSKKAVNIIVIPGNHDCDFGKDTKVRKNLINIIGSLGDSAIDESVISACSSIQQEYFDYRKSISDNTKLLYQDNLVSVYNYIWNDYSLIFYCYNSAYISEIEEKPGKLHFPINLLPVNIFDHKADLVISLFHHPFNWYNPINRREFYTHIHKTSDFYLTGHEHIRSFEKIDDLNENVVYHVEGTVLQESNDDTLSEFVMLGFDFKENTFKNKHLRWQNDKYVPNIELNNDWINYKRGRTKFKNKYSINHDGSVK